jgi:hypothetical protein
MTATMEAPAAPVAPAWRSRTYVVRWQNGIEPPDLLHTVQRWAEFQDHLTMDAKPRRRRDGSEDWDAVTITIEPVRQTQVNSVPRDLMSKVRAELLRRINAGQGEEEIMAALQGTLPLDGAAE